jgi:hypothetical protein
VLFSLAVSRIRAYSQGQTQDQQGSSSLDKGNWGSRWERTLRLYEAGNHGHRRAGCMA